MSCYKIFYDKETKCKMMQVVKNKEEYLQLRNSSAQKAMVRQVRNGNGNAKMRLLQCNYSCMPNEDGSLKGSTRMTTTVGMDVDHIAKEQMQEVKERILAKKDELGLLMLELSARGEGYHLVFKRKSELSQEYNLRWASDLLGVEFDKGAKDITRVFFTTTASEEDLLFLDDALFINEACLEGTTERSDSNRVHGSVADVCPDSKHQQHVPGRHYLVPHEQGTGFQPAVHTILQYRAHLLRRCTRLLTTRFARCSGFQPLFHKPSMWSLRSLVIKVKKEFQLSINHKL